MKKLKFTSLLCGTALLATIGFASLASAAQFVSIATGGTAGTYFPIGGAIAQAVSANSDLQATAESGNASVANVNLLSKGEIEVVFCQNDIAFWAFNGQNMFKSPIKNLRAVAALYPEHLQLIVTKEAKVKTLQDLKGKRIGVGAPGSGTEADAKAVFEAAGMSYNDMKVDFLDFSGVTDRFKDNQIDGGFVVAGFPTASIMDLATTKDVTLVSFPDDFMAQLVKKHPYFVASSIPANTYAKIDKETKTPAVMALLLTHDKVSDDVIYKFTKAMFDNIDKVQASHAKAKEIQLSTALDGVTVPLHPGAAKYFKEKGLQVK